MISAINELIPGLPIRDILLQLAGDQQQVYLVGGILRDLLLQRPGHDLDFVATGDVLHLARKTADRIGASFYVMDAVRQTARIIYLSPIDHHRWVLDFSLLRGESINEDLTARDFTINSIAMDLRHPEKMIDPLRGAMDIKEKVLRISSPTSFRDDPLRVLRAVRQSVELDLRMTPGTVSALKNAVAGLAGVSVERQRDELFRIFDSGRAAVGLRLGDSLGVFEALLPELVVTKGVSQSGPHTLDVFEHTLAVMDRLENLYSILVEPSSENQDANLMIGLAVAVLGPYRNQLKEHYSRQLHPDRSLRSLLLFAGLYHDAGKPKTRTMDPGGTTHFYNHEQPGTDLAGNRARDLCLSNAEVSRVEMLVRHHMRVHHLAKTEKEISRKALYRYYRDLDDAGVDLVLLSLADVLATYGVTITPEYWQRELLACSQLLDAWFNRKKEYLQPPKLLTGNDLINELGLAPGSVIGRLLESIREAQAIGQVTTREDALRCARERLMIEGQGNKDGR